MTEPLTGGAPPAPEGVEVAVVYAGDLRLERGCRALVISFRDTELVNSIGVSILLGVIDVAERKGARVAFSNVSMHTVKLFELLGLTRLVVLAESEEAALAILSEFAHAPSGGH